VTESDARTSTGTGGRDNLLIDLDDEGRTGSVLDTGPTRPDTGPPAPGAQAVQQQGSGLGLIVSIIVAAIVFVLAIAATGGQPVANAVPMLQTTNALYWVIGAIAILVAGAGAQYAERAAARAAGSMSLGAEELESHTAWIVASVATTAAVLLVATYHNAAMMVVGPLIAFLGNAGALLARDLLDDAGDASQRTATTIHALVIHTVAFLALGAVYLNKLPTPLAVLLVATIGGLLTLETLERGSANQTVRSVYALLAAGIMAQVMIALNWWQTHGWTGGAVLLVCFYIVSGVLLARTQRTVLRARDVVEFGAVSLVALVILAITA
jgi:hypothetical protein